MYKISQHFNMDEVCKSNVAIRNGISNKLPIDLLEPVTAVAMNILEPIREEFNRPINPSSWYRSLDLNTLIGGSKTSQHCGGEAVDFEVAGIDNYTIACWIQENLEYDQLILEHYNEVDPSSGWIHVSYSMVNHNRNISLRYDGKRYLRGLEDGA